MGYFAVNIGLLENINNAITLFAKLIVTFVKNRCFSAVDTMKTLMVELPKISNGINREKINIISQSISISSKYIFGMKRFLFSQSVVAIFAMCAAAHNPLERVVEPVTVEPDFMVPEASVRVHGSGVALAGAMRQDEGAVSAPVSLVVGESGGGLLLSWPAVEDANRYGVYYIVYDDNGRRTDTLLGKVTDTSAVITDDPNSGTPDIKYFGVSAFRGDAESAVTISGAVPWGVPYTIPFNEGFANGGTAKFYSVVCSPGASWGLLTDASGLAAVDGDNGCLGFMGISDGDYFTLGTHKIALDGAQNPSLVFLRYYKPEQKVDLTIYAQLPDGSTELVKACERIGNYEAVWMRELVSLAKYKDLPWVVLYFNYECHAGYSDGGALVAIDDIHVADVRDKDMAISLQAPAKVLKGQVIEAVLTISNNSIETLSPGELTVLANGREFTKGELNVTIPPFSKALLKCSVPTSALDEDNDSMELSVSIATVGDADLSNNSAIAVVALDTTWRNGISALTGVSAEGKVVLSWNEPADNSRGVVESFDEYAPWSTEFGEWRTIDKAKGVHGGVFEHSDYPGEGEAFAFKIMNPSLLGETIVGAHSGEQFIGAPFLFKDPATDENNPASDAWLISPELSGDRQELSFYVASQRSWNGWWEQWDPCDEEFYLVGSTTGYDVGDFTDFYSNSIRAKWIVDDYEWTRYSVTLKEGTRYFAIHHVTPGGQGTMLMFDDFAYIQGGRPVKYNVYRDGEFVEASDTTEFADCEASAGSHEYAVTAVYGDGSETKAVRAIVEAAGIGVINAGVEETSAFDVYNLQGIKVRSGVTSLDGVPPGIYIVNGMKVAVR